MRRPHKGNSFASVQERLSLDAIEGDMVRLRSGEYRAVLQASSVNFPLKSELEQEAILIGYRRFLNGLAYPLQLLVRIAPTDVETYLSALRASTVARSTATLRRLLRDHESFVRTIASERVLLDRRYYVVIPSELEQANWRPAARVPWRRHRERAAIRANQFEAARRKLTFRCDEVTQGLALFSVQATRLADDALVRLWREVLSEERHLTGTPGGPLPVVTGRRIRAAASDA